MPVTVKKVALWRRELDNRPGALAGVLEPLARAGASFQIAMGYRFPGNETRAAVELAPVTGKKGAAAAQGAGLQPSSIPTLVVTGDDRPGLGHLRVRERRRRRTRGGDHQEGLQGRPETPSFVRLFPSGLRV